MARMAHAVKTDAVGGAGDWMGAVCPADNVVAGGGGGGGGGGGAVMGGLGGGMMGVVLLLLTPLLLLIVLVVSVFSQMCAVMCCVVHVAQVETVTMTVGTQRRVVLEAVAFGTFLRDVETWVWDGGLPLCAVPPFLVPQVALHHADAGLALAKPTATLQPASLCMPLTPCSGVLVGYLSWHTHLCAPTPLATCLPPFPCSYVDHGYSLLTPLPPPRLPPANGMSGADL